VEGVVPAATLATACGVAPAEGRGTEVLGLFCASAPELVPQPQLFQVGQLGFQLARLPLDWHPASPIVLIAKTPMTVQRESSTRMASGPSLLPANPSPGFLQALAAESRGIERRVRRHCYYLRPH
jgi:hypothetical protein